MASQSARFLALVTLLFVPATWVAGEETDPLAPAHEKQITPARRGSGTIAFSKGNNIWTIEFDGTNPTQLTRTENDREVNSEPRLSPDGKKIAFSRAKDGDWGIYTMDADGNNVKRITKGRYARHPAWSPDGTKIAFNGGFHVMDADGKNVQQLTTAPTWSPPRWRVDAKYPHYDRFPSADGKHVVFTSRGSPRQIYTMDPDGKT